MVLSVGNDPTFKRFCEAFALTHLLEDRALRHQRRAGGQPATGHRHADAGDAAASDRRGGSSSWRR